MRVLFGMNMDELPSEIRRMIPDTSTDNHTDNHHEKMSLKINLGGDIHLDGTWFTIHTTEATKDNQGKLVELAGLLAEKIPSFTGENMGIYEDPMPETPPVAEADIDKGTKEEITNSINEIFNHHEQEN